MNKRKNLIAMADVALVVLEIARVAALASLGGSIAKDELYIINICKSILDIDKEDKTIDRHEDGDQKE